MPKRVKLLIVIAAVAASTPAATSHAANNGLVLSYFGDGGGFGNPDFFGGYLDFGSKHQCEVDRKVFLLLKQDGPDKKVGRERSFGDRHRGVWEVSLRGDAREGTYYAKVRETGSCRADESRKVTIDPPEPAPAR